MQSNQITNDRQALEKRAKTIVVISSMLSPLISPAVGLFAIQEEYAKVGNFAGTFQVAMEAKAGKVREDARSKEAVLEIIIGMVSKKSDSEMAELLVKVDRANSQGKDISADLIEFMGVEALKVSITSHFSQRFGQYRQASLEELFKTFVGLTSGDKMLITGLTDAQKKETADKIVATIESEDRPFITGLANKYLRSIGAQEIAMPAPVAPQSDQGNVIEFWAQGLTETQVKHARFELTTGGDKFKLAPDNTGRVFVILPDKKAGLLKIARIDELRQAKIDMNIGEHSAVVGLTVSEDIKPGDRIKLTFNMGHNLSCTATAVPCQVKVQNVSPKEVALDLLTKMFADNHTRMLCMLNVIDSPQAKQEIDKAAKSANTSNSSRVPNQVSLNCAAEQVEPLRKGIFGKTGLVDYAEQVKAAQVQAVDDLVEERIDNMDEPKQQKMRWFVIEAYRTALANAPDEVIQKACKDIQEAANAEDEKAYKAAVGRMFGYDGWVQLFCGVIRQAAPNMPDTEVNMIATSVTQAFGLLPTPSITTNTTGVQPKWTERNLERQDETCIMM
ncbi:MAG: hypothetical protein JSS50_00295 [Proteobacteria bacterium]|nr:hypothetical protein [Pseudomonadota bacterium]